MLDDFKRYWHNVGDEPQFLLDAPDPEARGRHRLAAIGAVAADILLVVIALILPNPPRRFDNGPRVELDFRKVTPLTAPPKEVMEKFKLTQKDPQTGKPATEVNLAQLLPRPELKPSPAPARGGAPAAAPAKSFTPPSAPAAAPVQAARIEIPKVDVPVQGQQHLPPGTSTQPEVAPPPPEKPKLAFENLGGGGSTDGRGSGITRMEPPKLTVEDAMRAIARSSAPPSAGGSGGRSSSGVGEMIQQDASNGQRQGRLQLLSDPQGVDFKPYLAQVLAAVKRNWLNVLPESARYGQRGQVVVQFIVGRNGFVPKLVIASPSGTQALDRASVAGISASVPFPPLPTEFRGNEVRLQLVFTYNMPRQ